MEYTSKLFVDFIEKLIAFDKDGQSVINDASNAIKSRDIEEKNEWKSVYAFSENLSKSLSAKIHADVLDAQKQMSGILSQGLSGKNLVFERLQTCKDSLALLSSSEKSIKNTEAYRVNPKNLPQNTSLSLNDIIDGKIDFISKAHEINELFAAGKKREAMSCCASFHSVCQAAESMLNSEIKVLRSVIMQDRSELDTRYDSIADSAHQKISSNWEIAGDRLDIIADKCKEQQEIGTAKTEKVYLESNEICKKKLDALMDSFCSQFPPQAFADEYARLYSLEPSFERYQCCKEMPQNVHVGTLTFDPSSLQLSNDTKAFLNRYYCFLYRNNKLCIPYCTSFSPDFNCIFAFDEEGRQNVVQSACDLGMRLFMMLPPGKLMFTFIDPVTLGESFAMFTRLVDVDDRTSEIINGKIWSSPADIEQKLKIMTDHISNVTQRCLQGKYKNIYEYNCVAGQNAEAYQILMLMDFPAGLTEQSLKLLEQIAASGPKCGVFTIIYRNESQYKKVSEDSYPLIANIEAHLQKFAFDENGTQITYAGKTVNGQPLFWYNLRRPDNRQMDGIIATLKKGIKSADKVVIGIERVNNTENSEIENTTKDGIRIPIGIHGAKEVQYLTLGVGGSHHALIAGVAGSGKSSLLHTIILGALTQYSPDELSIYLVDFKRGVEFKIYADFILPAFKVIAIESEREFGYNILLALEREQKIRADLFKKNHVEKIEEYRALNKKMPRVLVIMDEFQELFSNGSDEIAKKSAVIMERVVRQGRAFGIHLILSSQSYSNITGIDRSVFSQMAVRIVLKCSREDANMLLDNGGSEIDQISIDDPGRAVYNSEAGNKEYNSHFRVAYIDPKKYGEMLQKISDKTSSYAKEPTRILLSNIQDNKYSIFNQFQNAAPNCCPVAGRLYIGEPLSIANNMNLDIVNESNSNLLMLGSDTEKARNMFAFAILSLCINYRVRNRKAPETPFIVLINCKPLDDSYFKDIPQMIAKELLPEYVRYFHCGDVAGIHDLLAEMTEDVKNGKAALSETDKYFFVFGYQRAEELKSEIKLSQDDEIDNLFNLMPNKSNQPYLSPKEMFHIIVKAGTKCGIHTILWQDSFAALEQNDNNIMSYFNLKVAFDMTPEEFSRAVGENDSGCLGENNAIYCSRARDNEIFRPYQTPDEDWLRGISDKLH